jgi:hypothetical protein
LLQQINMRYKSSSNTSRADREKLYRRSMLKKKTSKYKDDPYEDIRKVSIKRFSHYILSFHFVTIIFILLYILSFSDTKIDSGTYRISQNKLGEIHIPDANYLYTIDFKQSLGIKAPLYSELEVEILNPDYSHYYSVYKDLWQEKHPNDDGVRTTYRDDIITLQILFPKAGTYYFRAFSHNHYTMGVITSVVKKRRFGQLLTPLLALTFGIISALLILVGSAIGYPPEMYISVRDKVALINVKLYYIYLLSLLSLVLIVIISNYYYIGYPTGGEHPTAPAKILQYKKIFYIG